MHITITNRNIAVGNVAAGTTRSIMVNRRNECFNVAPNPGQRQDTPEDVTNEVARLERAVEAACKALGIHHFKYVLANYPGYAVGVDPRVEKQETGGISTQGFPVDLTPYW